MYSQYELAQFCGTPGEQLALVLNRLRSGGLEVPRYLVKTSFKALAPGIEALHLLADARAVVVSASGAAVLLIWHWQCSRQSCC